MPDGADFGKGIFEERKGFGGGGPEEGLEVLDEQDGEGLEELFGVDAADKGFCGVDLKGIVGFRVWWVWDAGIEVGEVNPVRGGGDEVGDERVIVLG